MISKQRCGQKNVLNFSQYWHEFTNGNSTGQSAFCMENVLRFCYERYREGCLMNSKMVEILHEQIRKNNKRIKVLLCYYI